MVAGEAGGIPMQMPAGAGEFLVSSVEECAEKLLYLLRNPEAGVELARSGKEAVRQRFLLPRLISDELDLYADLLGARSASGTREGIR
jgi:trehalose synthase